MKKLIKYLISLTVIVALSAAFMANTHKTETSTKAENPPNCWIEPAFDWHGSCVYVDNNAVYLIDMDIYNICDNPATKIYDGTPQHIPTTQTSTTFCVENQLCTVDQNEDCFKVVVTLAKVNKVTNEIICSTQEIFGPYNCQELMNFSGGSILLN